MLGGVLIDERVDHGRTLGEGVVDLHEGLPLVGQRVLGEDRLDRALGLAGAAVDALLRIDHEHPAELVDAVDRADIDAGLVLNVDAGLGDDVRHLAVNVTEAARQAPGEPSGELQSPVSSVTSCGARSTSADLTTTWSKPAACPARSPAVSVWFV